MAHISFTRHEYMIGIGFAFNEGSVRRLFLVSYIWFYFQNAGCQSLDLKMSQKCMSEGKSRPISGCPWQTHSSHRTEDSSTTSSSFYTNVEDEVLSTSCIGKPDHNISNEVCSSNPSPFHQLRKDAIVYVSRALDRGRKNLWHFITSRLSALLSCSSVSSTSTHQFLKNYEDLNVFILAGEAFCGIEALEFRQRLKTVCESYVAIFHRQNFHVSVTVFTLFIYFFRLIVF